MHGQMAIRTPAECDWISRRKKPGLRALALTAQAANPG